jgi:hypothetical protein
LVASARTDARAPEGFSAPWSDHNDGVEGAKILADSEKKHCQCAMIDLNI